MSLILIIICIIEFLIILYLLLKDKIIAKFDINDYEIIILSTCRNLLRDVGDDIDIDDLCLEVKTNFYNELKEENILIPTKLDDLVVIAYIKNLIYLNNLLSEVENSKVITNDNCIDEVYNTKYNGTPKSVDMMNAINGFYE